MHSPNIGAPRYTKQIQTYLKGEIDNILKVGNCNTQL